MPVVNYIDYRKVHIYLFVCLLFVVYHDSAKDKVIWSKTEVLVLRD